jgi:hypothetical protein
MTDHQKPLIALFGGNDCRVGGEVSVFEVMAMPNELGEEHRRIARRQLVLATT